MGPRDDANPLRGSGAGASQGPRHHGDASRAAPCSSRAQMRPSHTAGALSPCPPNTSSDHSPGCRPNPPPATPHPWGVRNTVNKTFLEQKFILPIHPTSLSLLAPSCPATVTACSVITTSEWQCQPRRPRQWPPAARRPACSLSSWACASRGHTFPFQSRPLSGTPSPAPLRLVISHSFSSASFPQGGALGHLGWCPGRGPGLAGPASLRPARPPRFASWSVWPL